MKILCLANSYKEGGRCVAGIQLDENNHPVISNNRPVWIRPVCNTEHGQIPTNLCANVSALDVIEINNAVNVGTGYQSENTTFNEDMIRVIGAIPISQIDSLIDNQRLNNIFGNNWNAVYESWINNVNHSLMLIRTSTYEVIEKEREDRPHPQIRLAFNYNNSAYNLPITDPDFLRNYQKNPSLLNNVDDIYLVLSLGVVFNEKYYKLVATILY